MRRRTFKLSSEGVVISYHTRRYHLFVQPLFPGGTTSVDVGITSLRELTSIHSSGTGGTKPAEKSN
jgi:hypothetical protein